MICADYGYKKLLNLMENVAGVEVCTLLRVCLLIQHNDLLSLSGVGGVMVSIAAFQAVDLGSIPGQRTLFSSFCYFFV